MPQKLTTKRKAPSPGAIAENPVVEMQQPSEPLPQQIHREERLEERGGELGPEPSHGAEGVDEDGRSQQLH